MASFSISVVLLVSFKMNSFYFLIFGVLLYAGYVQAKLSDIMTYYVINGTDVGKYTEQFPFVVQVEYFLDFFQEWKPLCAASILNRSWLLSAAHCFEGKNYTAENTRIRAGTTHLGEGGVVHYVEYVRNHPDFRKAAKSDADISCVKLVTPLVYNALVHPADINYSDVPLPPNTPVTYIGWGATSVGGQQSKNLQFVVADTVDNTMCAEKYKAIKGNDLITPTMICAGNWAEGGVGSCQGDSGGPLYYNGIVYGIISFGHSCAKPEYPGVSTNIAKYAQWINETINENKVE